MYAQKPVVTKGSFEMAATKSSGPVNATFTVKKQVTDHVLIQFVPDKPFTLNAHIVDKDGKEVMQIAATNVSGRYVNNLDISSLPAGEYFVEVLSGDNNERNYRIPFTR
jgi:hypothetical protein